MLNLENLKTVEAGMVGIEYGIRQANALIGSADEVLADTIAKTIFAIEDMKESKLVSAGIKTATYGVVGKIATIGVETALSAVGVETSLDTLHSVADLAIGAGATMVGAGIVVSAFGNRNKTYDDLADIAVITPATETKTETIE
ncbi:MAG: hypothetical protein ACRCX8_20030 [Sarcina sp.]